MRKILENRGKILSDRYAELLNSSGEEEIHNLRVAVRRFRAARSLMRRTDLPLPPLSEDLRNLFKHLGRIRDLQIKISLLKETNSAGTFTEDLLQEWTGQMEKETQELPGDRSIRELPPDFSATVRMEEESDRGYRSIRARKALRRRLAKIGKLLDEGENSSGLLSDPVRLHRLRISIKKLRYLLELLREANVLRIGVKKIRDWQDGLGEIHDIDLILERLESFQISEKPAEERMEEWEMNRRHLREALQRAREKRVHRMDLWDLRMELKKLKQKAKG